MREADFTAVICLPVWRWARSNCFFRPSQQAAAVVSEAADPAGCLQILRVDIGQSICGGSLGTLAASATAFGVGPLAIFPQFALGAVSRRAALRRFIRSLLEALKC